jgi:hypothetical protein
MASGGFAEQFGVTKLQLFACHPLQGGDFGAYVNTRHWIPSERLRTS